MASSAEYGHIFHELNSVKARLNLEEARAGELQTKLDKSEEELKVRHLYSTDSKALTLYQSAKERIEKIKENSDVTIPMDDRIEYDRRHSALKYSNEQLKWKMEEMKEAHSNDLGHLKQRLADADTSVQRLKADNNSLTTSLRWAECGGLVS
jgi:hypothetical protein